MIEWQVVCNEPVRSLARAVTRWVPVTSVGMVTKVLWRHCGQLVQKSVCRVWWGGYSFDTFSVSSQMFCFNSIQRRLQHTQHTCIARAQQLSKHFFARSIVFRDVGCTTVTLFLLLPPSLLPLLPVRQAVCRVRRLTPDPPPVPPSLGGTSLLQVRSRWPCMFVGLPHSGSDRGLVQRIR